uniref:Uncharacterized protein n=1 Tax=Arundo donax TaxID=35708 RepID=A0A0A9FXS7_ARUDO
MRVCLLLHVAFQGKSEMMMSWHCTLGR